MEAGWQMGDHEGILFTLTCKHILDIYDYYYSSFGYITGLDVTLILLVATPNDLRIMFMHTTDYQVATSYQWLQ